MSITRFNNENVRFDFEPSKDFEYKTLEELFKTNGKDKVYLVKGVFINTKSRFGDSAVAVCEEYYVNLPSHLVSTVREIREDNKLVDDTLCRNCQFLFFVFIYSSASLANTIHLLILRTEFWFSSILVSALETQDSIMFLTEYFVKVFMEKISELQDSSVGDILL